VAVAVAVAVVVVLPAVVVDGDAVGDAVGEESCCAHGSIVALDDEEVEVDFEGRSFLGTNASISHSLSGWITNAPMSWLVLLLPPLPSSASRSSASAPPAGVMELCELQAWIKVFVACTKSNNASANEHCVDDEEAPLLIEVVVDASVVNFDDDDFLVGFERVDDGDDDGDNDDDDDDDDDDFGFDFDLYWVGNDDSDWNRAITDARSIATSRLPSLWYCWPVRFELAA
jgi:hypothetical protein